ncbi:MAG: type II toxin-antitoxin system RelE/ParE family toxin [Pseudomonadota bacterium]
MKWTDHALTQLRHIHDYIAQDSPLYAKRVSEALVNKTIGLDEPPHKGGKVPELNDTKSMTLNPLILAARGDSLASEYVLRPGSISLPGRCGLNWTGRPVRQ